MIARLVLAVSLVLLVAAPEAQPVGSVHVEIVETAAPLANDEAMDPLPAPHAPVGTRAARPPRSSEAAPPGPALARIFRPPRP